MSQFCNARRLDCNLLVLSVLFPFPDVFTPSFVELTSSDCEENLKTLRLAGVDFPFGELFYVILIFSLLYYCDL
jgi:hypothetical protein